MANKNIKKYASIGGSTTVKKYGTKHMSELAKKRWKNTKTTNIRISADGVEDFNNQLAEVVEDIQQETCTTCGGEGDVVINKADNIEGSIVDEQTGPCPDCK